VELLNGNPVERVSEFKYLGIIINEDLSWSKQVAAVVTRSQQILGVIFCKFYQCYKCWSAFYSELLEQSKFPALSNEHLFSKLCHLYKIQNHLTAFPNNILEDMPAPPMQLRTATTTHYLCHMLELTTSNIHSYQVHAGLEHPPF